MGMSYGIDRERRLVRSRMWGAVSTADFMDLASRIMVDPRFEPDFRSLGDLREVTALAGDALTFGSLASSNVYVPGTRRATVASREDSIFVYESKALPCHRSDQSCSSVPQK